MAAITRAPLEKVVTHMVFSRPVVAFCVVSIFICFILPLLDFHWIKIWGLFQARKSAVTHRSQWILKVTEIQQTIETSNVRVGFAIFLRVCVWKQFSTLFTIKIFYYLCAGNAPEFLVVRNRSLLT